MTNRTEDVNGFILIKDNPLSKVGVFPYSGAQINAPDPDRIYMVYRPAEELSRPDTLKSFALMPFVNEHEMLGKQFTPAEKKGVQGVTGDDVYFEYPYLKSSIKVFGENMKNCIRDGKLDLSAGYLCRYDFTPGEFEGAHYDAIQRDITGNHLALVDDGRCGADVRVMDSMTITFDEKELFNMNENQMSDDRIQALEEKLDKVLSFIDKLKPLEEAEHGETLDEDNPENYEDGEDADFEEGVRYGEKVEKDEPGKLAEEHESEGMKKSLDACGLDAESPDFQKAFAAGVKYGEEKEKTEPKKLDKEHESEGMKHAMDESMLYQRMERRNKLAGALSKHIGTFACDSMTLEGVAKYGMGKLKLTAPKGMEVAVVEAYLKDRPVQGTVKVAMDSADGAGANMINKLFGV